MDFLAKSYAQLLELFRSMTVGARIIAGLLLVVSVISVAYLFNHTASGADEYLMNGEMFPASQIAAMGSAFGKANLTGWQFDGNRCRVPRGQQAAFMAALADANALPKNFLDYMQSAVGEMNSFVPISRQKEMLKVALERELALVISSMHGIEAAEVLYDRQTDTGLNQKETVTATVSVRTSGNDPLAPAQAQTIRRVVAGAISNLSPQNVVVADQFGISASGGGDQGSVASGYEDAYGANKRMYEQDWYSKIRDALRPIPGVNVAVNVELNPELENVVNDTKYDKPVAYDVQEFSSNSNMQGATAGGRPGLAEQGGINVGGVVTTSATSGPKNTDEKTTTRTKNTVSTTTTVKKGAPLTPRRVSVTVGVLSSYYEQIWAQRNPAAAGAESKKPKKEDLDAIEAEVKENITKIVTELLPLPQNSATTGQIEVTPQVTIVTYQQMPQTQIQPPSITEKGLTWFNEYWSTIGMLVLGLVSLLVLRSMVRAVPAPESKGTTPTATPAPAQAVAIVQGEQASPAEVQEAVAKLKRRVKSGPSMRDELVEVVREDPDTAANILRSWIGSAT